MTGRWPKGSVVCLGGNIVCLGEAIVFLGGHVVVLPPTGRVENANKAAAAGAPRQAEQADHPPHTQLAAPLHARAHIAHRARTAGVARRRPWNSRVRETKQEEPISATTGTSATCVVRLACAACMRGAACTRCTLHAVRCHARRRLSQRAVVTIPLHARTRRRWKMEQCHRANGAPAPSLRARERCVGLRHATAHLRGQRITKHEWRITIPLHARTRRRWKMEQCHRANGAPAPSLRARERCVGLRHATAHLRGQRITKHEWR